MKKKLKILFSFFIGFLSGIIFYSLFDYIFDKFGIPLEHGDFYDNEENDIGFYRNIVTLLLSTRIGMRFYYGDFDIESENRWGKNSNLLCNLFYFLGGVSVLVEVFFLKYLNQPIPMFYKVFTYGFLIFLGIWFYKRKKK